VNPDVLVVAQGGKAVPMDVPGSDKDIVLSRSDAESILGGRLPTKGGLIRRFLSLGAALFVRFFYNPKLLRKLLRLPFPFKKRVAILGGGFAGVELGETLTESGKQVAIVEPSKRMGSDIEIIHRWVFLKHLREAGANLLTKAEVTEITDKGVKITQEGSSQFIEADTVVPINITTNKELADTFEGKIPQVFVVGDCAEPAKLQEAITAGFVAGHEM
jgi:2,4-dienoyl-CoA reductase (NADPH2)